MSDTDPLGAVKLASIFHPSDFSEASGIAFAHALRIALVTGARLDLLHVSSSGASDWLDFPAVRATLERWQLLPNGSSMGDLTKLGIDVNKIVIPGQNPVAASLDFLGTHPADLIVLAVHQYEGRTRWMKQRVGEPIARGAGEMTLFIPHGTRGFVSQDDGALSLRNVLIPIAHKPHAEPAVEAAGLMVRSLGIEAGTFCLLHAGQAAEAPVVSCRCPAGWALTRLVREGDPSEVIVNTAETIGADLIVMTTEGPQGFLDALRGSTSERVLRRTPCPVMSLPADQWLSRIRRFWIN
jgi:nucleotide-binding universal stress UspA family protein